MADIGGILGGSGIQLEQQATNAFGAAVSEYSGNQLASVAGAALRSQTGRADDQIAPPRRGRWDSTHYAEDMVKFAPKPPFLFKVSFQANPPYDEILFPICGSSANIQYVVKTIDRPKVSYNYEDVNMYNFRTRVLKSISHGEMTLIMIDDVSNTMHDFLNNYRLAHSPISKFRADQNTLYEQAGMNFADPNSKSMAFDSANRGILANGQKEVLKTITISQVFGNIHSSSTSGNGYKQNDFVFINPRISNFDFDQASQEASEAGQGTISFDYDALYIQTTRLNGSVSPRAPGPSDINARSSHGDGNSSGLSNSLIDAAINIGSRILGNTAATATRSLLGGMPPFLVGPLGHLGSTVNSTTSDITRHTLRTATNSPNQNFAPVGSAQIRDNSSSNERVISQISPDP